MAEAQGELDLLRGLLDHAVADADNLERPRVAIGDTDDHVVHQGAGQSVQCARVALIVGTSDHQLAFIVLLNSDGGGDRTAQGALRTLDSHVATIDGHLDTGWDGDRELANS